MTWAAYGHGSFFTGGDDAHDVDVMVITDEPMNPAEAARRVIPFVYDRMEDEQLDVAVYHPLEVSRIDQVIARHGVLLDGEDIAARFAPVRPVEWSWLMCQVMLGKVDWSPAEAALAALRAIWAAEGRMVIPKSCVIDAAAGTPWEDLARAAWRCRRSRAFDHPDLSAVLAEGFWAPAGDAASAAFTRPGWSCRETFGAALTVYRSALSVEEVAAAAAGMRAADEPQEHAGGRTKILYRDSGAMAGYLGLLARVANAYWWGVPVDGMEPIELHRYGPGAEFPPHVDRHPLTPNRLLNVVAMIQPADKGGQLTIEIGGDPIEPRLAPGDVVMFDSGYRHYVTPVEAGERVTMVVHVVRQPRQVAGPTLTSFAQRLAPSSSLWRPL